MVIILGVRIIGKQHLILHIHVYIHNFMHIYEILGGVLQFLSAYWRAATATSPNPCNDPGAADTHT